jgi:hypothetical protein
MLLALLPSVAEAKGKSTQSPAATPLKDCTRVNGRFGYYGNVWCSPAEQERWDRFDAARREK